MRRAYRGRSAGLRRVLALARRATQPGATLELRRLAREFDVHPRTIRRDLEALEDVGWPLPVWRVTERVEL